MLSGKPSSFSKVTYFSNSLLTALIYSPLQPIAIPLSMKLKNPIVISFLPEYTFL